jgi:4-methyl-5(b-hydroxyethyl)-thiazole monophosphate biosynthesis
MDTYEIRGMAMKRVVVPLAPGFEEIETITVVDILRRAGVAVSLASVHVGSSPMAIEGRTGIKVMPDISISEVQASDFDMIVLPGGLKGAQTLQNDPHVARLLRDSRERNRPHYIGAICAAPIVLATNNMIAGRRLTSHPSVKDQLDGAIYDDARVVIDGNLVTSRGPGTAMEFALTLVKVLEGQEKMQEITEAVLAAV